MSKVIKRFVAGAVCPKCAAMDCLRVYKKDGEDFRECVDCGFHEKMYFAPQMRELDTRVNQSYEQRQAETQVLKIHEALKPDEN